MVEDALDYAQVGARLRVADVDLASLLDGVKADLTGALRERGATVEAGPLPRVRGDADLIYPVLLNLVSNAVKHNAGHPAPWVRVSATRRPGGGGWRVEVTDNGPGVRAEDRERVFALFARGEGRGAGMGIGLATCRRVVEAHGGRMGIEESPGGGATAWFDLPSDPHEVQGRA